MRVAHYCRRFSPLSETFIYDQISGLEQQGAENHVLTHWRENEAGRPFERVTTVPWPSDWNLRRIGCRLLELAGARTNRTSYWTLVRPRLRAELERIGPDVVHAHFGRAGAAIVPVAQALSIPLIVSFYGHDVSEMPRRKRWRAAYERLWPQVTTVLALSEEMKNALAALGCPPSKIKIIHLARNLDAFPFRAPREEVSRLVSVGRLTAKKGHFDAIKAVGRAASSGLDVHLEIVGGGPLESEVAAFIRENGLEQQVTLRGPLDNEEVAATLRESDAFVLCSKTAPNGDREGTPTVLVEAQATGLPCLSTRHAGIPEMIPPENHEWLAEEGNVDDITGRLKRLLSAPHEERRSAAERGRAKMEAEFNLDRETERLHSLYLETASV